MAMGRHNGSTFSPKNMVFTFNNDTILMDSAIFNMNFSYTYMSVSNSAGNLLFYSNGMYINNRMNDTMPNSYGLSPADYTNDPSMALYGLRVPQVCCVYKI